MLIKTLKKLEHKEGDSIKKASLKGLAEGALQGFIVLGAVTLISDVTNILKKKSK